jgi:hypothetical protein
MRGVLIWRTATLSTSQNATERARYDARMQNRVMFIGANGAIEQFVSNGAEKSYLKWI